MTTVRSRYTEALLNRALLNRALLNRALLNRALLNRALLDRAAQYAVLGAGLDTSAFRSGPETRVFETDHPATQKWKKGPLEAAGHFRPRALFVRARRFSFVPADFEAQDPVRLPTGIGLDIGRPVLVSWLGVSYYLTRDAIAAVLAGIGRLAPGTELVMDYALLPSLRDAAGDAYAEITTQVVGEYGEPSLSLPAPDEVNGLPKDHGFEVTEHLRLEDAVPRRLWRRTDALGPFDYFRLVRAAVAPDPGPAAPAPSPAHRTPRSRHARIPARECAQSERSDTPGTPASSYSA